jgi:hypothetical protein
MNITQEQAIKRLENPKNLANRFGNKITHVPIQRPGRAEGSFGLTTEQRSEIAIRSRLGETQTSLAEEFKTTQQNVSQIERGVGGQISEARVQDALDAARDKALQKLMLSLGLITEDKLQDLNATALSTVARNMATVVERSMPKEDRNSRINLVLYAPELRKESGFKIVEIG